MESEALQELGVGALLHDVGKTKIDPRIVNKQGPLTAEEWAVIRAHPQTGVDILREGPPLPQAVYRIVHEHHEKYDGSGYPRGLQRHDIHLYARMTCVIDVFDAMTTNRAYKQRMSFGDALKVMHEEMAGCFEYAIWRQFVLMLAFPEGAPLDTQAY